MTVSASTIGDDDNNAGTGAVTIAGTVKLQSGAVIDSLDGGEVSKTGMLESADTVSLSNDTLTNTSHIVNVDNTATLTLTGTTIDGGTINNGTIANLGAGGGTIAVTGDNTIDSGAQLNDGSVIVSDFYTLTLSAMTATPFPYATLFRSAGTGAVTIAGTVKLQSGAVIDSLD